MWAAGLVFFLDAAKSSGFDVMGVEPSPRAVHISRSKYSIPVVCGLLHPDDDLPRDFGVLTSWDVIEHVPNPLDFISTCSTHLRNGGLLVLETPAEDSFIQDLIRCIAFASNRKIDLRNLIYHRSHRYYFTKLAIESLLYRCGFHQLEFFNERTDFQKACWKMRFYKKVPLVGTLATETPAPALYPATLTQQPTPLR